MTDKLQFLSTNIVTQSQPTDLSPKSIPPVLEHENSISGVDEQEEPYTIKCICGFTDDDGLTIYCDNCDTWQHIECFYPHNIQEAKAEDFTHSCADCQPRTLDRQLAIDRQNYRRSGGRGVAVEPERKPKRPPPKTQRRKVRPTDSHANNTTGPDIHPRPESIHAHQHKKSKSTHRPSHSISSQATKRSPSYGQKGGNPHGLPPTPTTPPPWPKELDGDYRHGMRSLFLNDSEIDPVSSSSFINLTIPTSMSLWLREPSKLWADAKCAYDEVFKELPANIDELQMTPKGTPKVTTTAIRCTVPGPEPEPVVHAQSLTCACPLIEKGTPLMELNGQIGFQGTYCGDPDSQWATMPTPLPFVFFHPQLPIYIDTRKEGSPARYVRRSCKPNSILQTFLSEGSEYHFWLVSDRQLGLGEAITIGWEFVLPQPYKDKVKQLIPLDGADTSSQPEYDPNEIETYHKMWDWVHQILQRHGDCACYSPNCAFKRFFYKYIKRAQPASEQPRKKSRKPKGNTISPTSTGPANNSRAASEGQGDDAEDDSGSSHSKPPSRDMTPARQGSFDTLGILTEPTDRDKRKVAMVEDSFRRMEQQQGPPRKKKRTSDGGVSSSSTKSRSRAPTGSISGPSNGTTERRYVNAGTNRSTSGSPTGTMSPNLTHGAIKRQESRQESMSIPARGSSDGLRPAYVDASVQTDLVDGEWFSGGRSSPKSKKRVISLTKRLLQNRHRLRADEVERRRLTTSSPISVASAFVKMDLASPVIEAKAEEVASPTVMTEDRPSSAGNDVGNTTMYDATSHFPIDVKSPPMPAMLTNGDVPIKVKSTELRVQMPPVPTFNETVSVGMSATTPLSSASNVVQSPFSTTNMAGPFGPPAVNGVGAHPSPVKKKLSLSDYTKSRLNKAAAVKPVGASLKPPTINEEGKSPPASDVVMMDSPTAEKAAE